MEDYRKLMQKKRKEMRLSEGKLAKAIGVTQPFIHEIENGRKSPSIETLFKICEALEIEIIFRDKSEENDVKQ